MTAFLGMGLLGSNFVRAMLNKGGQVNVWNRTTEKAKALEQYGAKAYEDVAEAVKDADTIHVTLKDDASVDEVLEKAKAGMKPGAIIIDHTTTSAAGAVERTKKWKERGFTYQHAPVFMGPQNALESTGTMLVSGEQEVIKKIEPELSKMTGKVMNFGDEAGKAAGMKLVGNLFLMALTSGISDALALGKAEGIAAKDVAGLLEAWNPAAMVPARLKKITEGNFEQPSWELNMARKDARLMMEGAKKGGTHLFVIPAVAEQMDKWIDKGHGNNDWTIIAKDSI